MTRSKRQAVTVISCGRQREDVGRPRERRVRAGRGRMAAPRFTDSGGNGASSWTGSVCPRMGKGLVHTSQQFGKGLVRYGEFELRGSLGIRQRVGHPQLDEGLTRDADAPGFSIDRPQ